MKYNDMLREVFYECYREGVDEKIAYKRASECLHRLLERYKLDDNAHFNFFINKENKKNTEYIFTEKHVQLFKFIKEIDKENIMGRSNPDTKNQTLENFSHIADVVEGIINTDKYPAITDDLKSTLRTPEFFSFYYLHKLVKKITLLFQYVCQNNYSDTEIYNDVTKHIDVLLHTYAGHEYYSDFMNKVYYESLDIKMPHESNNIIELNDISIYRGVKKYIQDAFNAVTKSNSQSNYIEADLIQGDYRYVFEFDRIEEIKDFIGKYCEYIDISCEFADYCNQSPKSVKFVNSSYLCQNIMMNEKISFLYTDEVEKQNKIYSVKEFIENDIKHMHTYIESYGEAIEQIKILCKKLRKIQDSFINNYMYTYGNGNMLRIISFINILKKDVFEQIKSNTYDELAFEIIEAVFYDGFIMLACNFNYSSEAIAYQLSYKSFKMQLSNIDIIKIKNKEISNEDIIKGISKALNAIDTKVTNDFENDNELYSAISNAVGNYLYKIFDESESNKSKIKTQ